MQRSLWAFEPSLVLSVRVAFCLVAGLTFANCSQIVEFDRSKVADAGPQGPSDVRANDNGGDRDTPTTPPKSDVGDEPAPVCNAATHEGCMPNELCCAGPTNVLRCVPTSLAQCEGCGVACDSAVANDCSERTCGCGWMSKVECSGATPRCDANQDKCVECVSDADCSANPTNRFCFVPGTTPNAKDNTCVACDPVTNTGCDGTMPICNAEAVCEKCTESPDNCGGGRSCLESGACECSKSSECMTPTTPICDGDSKVCVACATDEECDSKTAGTVCITASSGAAAGSCAACDPADNRGCNETDVNDQCKPGAVPACVDCLDDGDCSGATPLCDLTINKCVACDAAAIEEGTRDARCDAKSPSLPACVTSGGRQGRCEACDPADHTGCTDAQLCCTGTGGTPTCEDTDPALQCAACDTACESSSADRCLATRECACGDGPACGGETPICLSAACVQCAEDADCTADPAKSVCDPDSHSCVDKSCTDHDDCLDVAAPICDVNHVCVACTIDAECSDRDPTLVCVASGAAIGSCKTCDPATPDDGSDDRGCPTGEVCDETTFTCNAR